ncbi:hypothetical protein SAMN04487897_112101 [Paenibacillus sp. yr247]|uniref:hypothetical protein n=1 Tax=Paenibacillus sp. yr247 TaxID=1761880 RepID=UPI00088F9123|nr:hypothetical protein [Paenibacillus sp. yr247]SDO35234.1 hypothetical protein SAMN04487897_112101 [Paenibacillus sp. yr247]
MKGYIWLRIAGIYLIIGMLLGIYMDIKLNFQMSTIHAHINLLGFSTLAISGLIYCVFPKAAKSRLGVGHFWLHNIGLPVMIIGLYVEISGLAKLPLIRIGGSMALLSIILLVINLFVNVNEATKNGR